MDAIVTLFKTMVLYATSILFFGTKLHTNDQTSPLGVCKCDYEWCCAIIRMIKIVQEAIAYPCDFPLWVHQCHELKTNMSMPFQASPATIESNLSTLPTFSRIMSTK
jgi:hypothetical protein